jgi:phage recombination protein Bet
MSQQIQTTKNDKELEFLPFGGDTKIKLSVAMVQKFLATPTKAGHICSERDAMRFLMLCQARGLNPWEGDCFVVGYDSKDGPQFSLITAHQAFLKRAEMHPEFDGMQSGVLVRTQAGIEEHEGDFVDDSEELLGGWAKVHFKARRYPIYRKLHLSCFVKETAIWRANPAGMIVKTAEADALRSAFPTKCGGMYLQSELPEPGTDAAFRASKPIAAPEAMVSNGNGSHSTHVELGPLEPATTSEHPQPRQTTPEATPQEKLRVFVEQEGFDFSTFDLWAEGTGQKPQGAKWESFADVPDKDASRLLRARDGLKKGMTAAKGAAQ